MIHFKIHNPKKYDEYFGHVQPRFLEQSMINHEEYTRLCLEDMVGLWHGQNLKKLFVRKN